MCVALIGGMDRLEREYKNEAERFGINLKVFTRSENRLGSKIKGVDALVIFTNKISHTARNEAKKIIKTGNIPVFRYHSCGVCTLRECFQHLTRAIQ
ncbi:MAG: DUF2325 domain-containing protein [Dissulfuribacterales bacterium]